MGKIRKWILKIVMDEIKENGCEIDGYVIKVIDGTFTIKDKNR